MAILRMREDDKISPCGAVDRLLDPGE